MKILIAGGTGLIGSALGEFLLAVGHDVGIISRSPDRVDQKFRSISWDEDSLLEELADTDAVVNLAGASLAGDHPLKMHWTTKRKQTIISSRVEAGRKLTQAISQIERKLSVFIQASAIGYYGNQGLVPADETTEMGNDFLAEVCQKWESSTSDIEQMGIRRAVIRIGLVLSRSSGLLPLLTLPFRFFIGGEIGRGSQYLSWIHISDIVNSIHFLLDDPTLQGIYNLSAPNPETNSRFSKLLGKTIQRPVWLTIPSGILKIALGEASTLALDGRPVYPTQLLKAGYKFTYTDLEDALKDLLRK